MYVDSRGYDDGEENVHAIIVDREELIAISECVHLAVGFTLMAQEMAEVSAESPHAELVKILDREFSDYFERRGGDEEEPNR